MCQRSCGGGDKAQAARDKNLLASDLDDRGDFEEALVLYEEAVAGFIEVHGHDHPDVANSKFNIALLLRNMDKAAESKQMFTEAAGIFRAALGADHPHTKMAERRSAET